MGNPCSPDATVSHVHVLSVSPWHAAKLFFSPHMCHAPVPRSRPAVSHPRHPRYSFNRRLLCDLVTQVSRIHSRPTIQERKGFQDHVPGSQPTCKAFSLTVVSSLTFSQAIDFLEKCLTFSPQRRITVVEALQHSYFEVRTNIHPHDTCV